MIGRLRFSHRGKGSASPGHLYGMSILYTEIDPQGFWAGHQLKKAGRNLRQCGVVRLLTPKEFEDWAALTAYGLRPVETAPFVRTQATSLAIESLVCRGLAPDRATVALRGQRADRDVKRTAIELCPKVRNLVVDVPRGGQELANWLRWEFGIPILPQGERGEVAIQFHGDSGSQDEVSLKLYGPQPQLAGLVLCAPELCQEDREDLGVMAALWEGGRLGQEDIKILDRTP